MDRTSLTRGDVSALGFSADQVLAAVVAERPVIVGWADGPTTGATLTVADGNGDIEFLERSWTGGDNGTEQDGDCGDIVTLQLDVSLTTDDGALSESWTLTAETEVATGARVTATLDNLRGTLDLSRFAPGGQWDAVTGWFDLELGGDGPSGSLYGQASRSTVAENFDIATVNAAAPAVR